MDVIAIAGYTSLRDAICLKLSAVLETSMARSPSVISATVKTLSQSSPFAQAYIVAAVHNGIGLTGNPLIVFLSIRGRRPFCYMHSQVLLESLIGQIQPLFPCRRQIQRSGQPKGKDLIQERGLISVLQQS